LTAAACAFILREKREPFSLQARNKNQPEQCGRRNRAAAGIFHLLQTAGGGAGRRDQLDGGSRSEEKAAGQPLPICCKFGKDETAVAGSAGQDQRHRETLPGEKCKGTSERKNVVAGRGAQYFFRKKQNIFCRFVTGTL